MSTTALVNAVINGLGISVLPHRMVVGPLERDKMLDLEKGFLLNELYREMDGRILGQYTLKGIYEN